MQAKCYYLFNMFTKIHRFLSHNKKNEVLSPGEFAVIWTVDRSEEKALHPSQICKHIGIARPSLTPILRELERKEFIGRRADSEDGRRYLVEVTEKCREIREKEIEEQMLVFDQLIGSLAPGELDTLLNILSKMEKNMEKRLEDAPDGPGILSDFDRFTGSEY